MPTLDEVYGVGVPVAGSAEHAFVIQFTDDRQDSEINYFHLWTGVLHFAEDHYFAGPTLRTFHISSPTPNFFSRLHFKPIGQDFSDPGPAGLSVQIYPGQSIGILAQFAAQVYGFVDAQIVITTSVPNGAQWVWVRAVSRLEGSNTNPVPNYRQLPIVSGPTATGAAVTMAIDAPRLLVRTKVRGKSFMSVFKNRVTSIVPSLHLVNSFVRGGTDFIIGKRGITRGNSKVRVGPRVFVRGATRIRAGEVAPVRANTHLRLVNVIARAKARIRVGRIVPIRMVVRVRTFRATRLTAFTGLHIVFINLDGMKSEMQIIFGVDTGLITKQLTTIPAINGVAFSQNLEHVLIETGTETVRRLNFPNPLPSWSASGLYEIDYMLGRFRWLGPNAEPIELTYRHSATRITDQNIIASLIKASAFIQERLKPSANISDPRFRRGGAELAMSFLLDAAIWNTTQTMSAGAAAGAGSRRIDLMQTQKREFERRAYETLGPFLVDPVPGIARRAALARPKSIRVYEG
ncbi:MAG: hypothetical protein A3G34_10495 [Candidatus Lindowbacteria bacterium RIFCSPLOWO2_12_FULL_62_27]|nr:MAG: hypothetical protein A3G34_10495 [Candidatus Lindowbacteria bacterium RIFCSPLOWO2_12_FULL_62_27]